MIKKFLHKKVVAVMDKEPTVKVDLPLSKKHVRQLLEGIDCARDEAGAYEDWEYEDLRKIILGLGG